MCSPPANESVNDFMHRAEVKDCSSPQDIWSLLKPCVLLRYLHVCTRIAGAFDRRADMNIKLDIFSVLL